MCAYCEKDMLLEKPYAIQNIEINCGVLGTATLFTGLNEDMNYELGIHSSFSKPIIEETKINYCPMCGRKL